MKKELENAKARAKEIEYFLKEICNFFASYEDKNLKDLYIICSSNYLRATLFVDKMIELEKELQLLQKQLETRDLL